ncbi:MAG: DUF2130 domain-containing protein [bacterium]|nr:DUF2130 domain-containing protein [bacterium]
MNQIKCPKCGSLVEITEVLKNEIKQESQVEFEKELRGKIEEEKKTEIIDLKNALAEKNKKVEEMREQELKLREEKRKIEEREKELNLEVARQVDAARKQTEEQVLKRAAEDHRLKDLEKEKLINDLKKSLEEAQRKAQQGSQQTQGEVLELDLEETLRATFPQDLIEPIKKGEEGADIRQIVKSPLGNNCGVILWEVKRTKAWSDKWLVKLKDDLRAERANIPVIIATTLPKEMKTPLELVEGVWVTNLQLSISLAALLRKNLLDVTRQKAMSDRKTEKADLLYDFVTSHEFSQQVEALVEVYREMQDQVTRERMAFEKSWKAREEQIKRLLFSTANIYGGVQGLVGSSMPQVRGLDLLELEDGEN